MGKKIRRQPIRLVDHGNITPLTKTPVVPNILNNCEICSGFGSQASANNNCCTPFGTTFNNNIVNEGI